MQTGPIYISREHIGDVIDWKYFVDALSEGHKYPTVEHEDTFLGSPSRSMLSRAAWIEGLGIGVKSVTYMADNVTHGRPAVQGAMLLFEETYGDVIAVIDGRLVTDIKTAADSVLAARHLARKDSKTHLVIGAGIVASNAIRAYQACFPDLETVYVWNHRKDRAVELAKQMLSEGIKVHAVEDLPNHVARADIISTATATSDPILFGKWVEPGTHIDLIGAFRKEMREADDAVLRKSRIFVDSRDTTISHLGELMIPLKSRVISETDIIADMYELCDGKAGRKHDSDITTFINGGGAHLDLMTAHAILKTIEQ